MKKLLILLMLTTSVYASSWECINRNAGIPTCNTWRMKTPQGWLVSSDNQDDHISMSYVPDADHSWIVDN